MADVKISELAKTVGVSVDKLLSQIKEAVYHMLVQMS